MRAARARPSRASPGSIRLRRVAEAATARAAPVDHSMSNVVARVREARVDHARRARRASASANAARSTAAGDLGVDGDVPEVRAEGDPQPRDAVVEPVAEAAGGRRQRRPVAGVGLARSRRAAAPGRSPCAPSARRGRRCRTGSPATAGTRPKVGLSPGSPQKRARDPDRAAAVGAERQRHHARARAPPRCRRWSRPASCAGSHGLRVTPVSGLSVTPFQPNSGVVVLPGSTAPCAAQRGHGRRVVVPRPGRVDRPRAAQRRPAAREEQVLDRDRARRRARRRLAALPARLGGARPRPAPPRRRRGRRR